MKYFAGFLSLVFILLLVIWGGSRIYANYDFNRDVGGHLKRAADANTVELAAKELDIALTAMEADGMTSGSTAVFFKTPAKDVGFWYENIKSAREELALVKPDTSQMEKTNILMKLRETLTDDTSDGTSITAPSGISVFPHNGLYMLWGWGSLIAALFWAFVAWLCYVRE